MVGRVTDSHRAFSWYGLTTNYLGSAIENSIWAVAFFAVAIGLCRSLPDFDGLVRVVLAVAIVGIAGYLTFLVTVDVPMYLRRWRAAAGHGSKLLKPLEGLRDVSTRWVVTHDLTQWKNEIAWCRFILVWRSGQASHYASSTRSRVILPAVEPTRQCLAVSSNGHGWQTAPGNAVKAIHPQVFFRWSRADPS